MGQTAKTSVPGSTGVSPVGCGVLATTNFILRLMRIKSLRERDALANRRDACVTRNWS